MTLLHQALRAGHAQPVPLGGGAATVVVAGGGGVLGSEVLKRLLGQRRFAHVKVLATRGLTLAMHGLETVQADGLAEAMGAPDLADLPDAALADTGIVVFDRERQTNGRERPFLRPQPEQLAPLAAWLHRRGVRHLLVVLPHAPASLPDALTLGLANLDEHAVSALGFTHLVFVRSAQAQGSARASQCLQRLADGVLAQLGFMVAASSQPVRPLKLAQFVTELAQQLPVSAAGTRVAPPELVWQAAQLRDPAPLVRAWLDARELPPIVLPRKRL